MSQVTTAPNTLLFGSKFAHNAQGVLHGDECAHCGKRTHGGRGVQVMGYNPANNTVLRPESVPAVPGSVMVLVGEDCYFRNRSAIKPWSTTVRTKAGQELMQTVGLDGYKAQLAALQTGAEEAPEAPAEFEVPEEEVEEAPEAKETAKARKARKAREARAARKPQAA